MRKELRHWLKSFLVELAIYAVLVVAYYLLVLHLIGDWLFHVFKQSRPVYAVLALALIVGQGYLLEVLTRVILSLVKPRVEAE